MANITLSVPDWLYELIKKYKHVNWSEIARRAITLEALSIKAEKEGLTREEVLLLMEMLNIKTTEEKAVLEEDILQSLLRQREKRRIEKLSKVGY
ncbi:MAG: hypothetical protein QXX32_07505 [Thermofilum sp.]|jgi:hypothetical protein|uniref:Uncharacterized protein n=2 Tax=Thermofilum adornatum TaxID=1365176 RepID=S5ZC18_9CREN|nr:MULTISPECIES: hypothetical protein [Thermofilum]AGT34563.1 hypothetical protein N186_00825 [Thermofilum adornatum]AJB42299.1 hypothetical protein TCARB_1253 [Thermofilum adornatum 1505]MCC5997839.1 hypothetical protein [Thermofilum sp.]